MSPLIRKRREGGQAIVMVTLALIAMCGVVGLAVDLGWSYFVKKSAQAAADTGALAAVKKAQSLGFHPPFSCGDSTGQIYCTDDSNGPESCGTGNTASGNLASACTYASLNGFAQGGKVNVTVDADVIAHRAPPTVTGVAVDYWVTVRVNQQIPQLFSAVLGNTQSLVSARATAALTNVIFNASLVLLNRENDAGPVIGNGVDMTLTGGGSVSAPGGMIVSSNLNAGGSNKNPAAVTLKGSSAVTATPFSLFRGTPGSCDLGNGNDCDASHWSTALPTYEGVTDGTAFQDPTTGGKATTQPPLDTAAGANTPIPVLNGDLSRVATNSGGNLLLKPGVYYAVNSNGTPTGGQLQFTGSTPYKFDDSSGGTTFGQYVFFGGLTTSSGSQTITFSAGRYVFAGVTSTASCGSGLQASLFCIDNGTTLNDATSVNNQATQTDGGELFIFTNGNYQWAAGASPDGSASWSSGNVSNLAPSAFALNNYSLSNFEYAPSFSFKGGNNASTSVALSGLNPGGTGVPSTGTAPLTNYEPFVFWQDRSNSQVVYDSQGNVEYNSGPGHGSYNNCSASSTINNPCTQSLSSALPNSPEMDFLATPNTHLNGYIYQPRGGWMVLQGHGTVAGPLRVITGALTIGGSPNVTLTGTSSPITITETALIE
jgi:hypothetical protein